MIERCVAFAVLLQSLEMLALRRGPLAIVTALASAVALVYPHPAPFAFMLVGTWGIAWCFGGTFNGGSDSMTVLLTLACLIGLTTGIDVNPFVAALLILTYVVAGLSKLLAADWRSGKALREILEESPYAYVKRAPPGAAWAVMVFECTFPLALKYPLPYAVAGVIFHAANVYYFGLNRFFWIWLAAYPALFTNVGRA